MPAHINDRLIKQFKLVIFNRMAKVTFDGLAFLYLNLKPRLKEMIPVTAFGLGTIKGKVGIAQQIFFIAPVLRIHANPDRGRCLYFIALKHETFRHTLNQALRDKGHFFGRSRFMDQNREFIPAKARHNILIAQTHPHAFPHPL